MSGDRNERDYIRGRQSAYAEILGECLRQFGHEAKSREVLISELEEARATILRILVAVSKGKDGDEACERMHLADLACRIESWVRT